MDAPSSISHPTAVRLYLRRIMYNDKPETEEFSAGDRRRMILSLEHSPSIGRNGDNAIIFLDGTEIVQREAAFISRKHAEILHRIDDETNYYYLIDSSENGTYINDKRLKKHDEYPLNAGDTIKFGHKNGSLHKAGQTYPNTEPDFAFSVTTALSEDPLFKVLDELREFKAKVYIGSPFVEECELEKKQRVMLQDKKDKRGDVEKVEKVERKEADSTGLHESEPTAETAPEHTPTSSASPPQGFPSSSLELSPSSSAPELPSTSESTGTVASSSTTTPMANGTKQPTPPTSATPEQMPSTSQSVILGSYPKKAPHAQKFDNSSNASWTNCIARRSRNYQNLLQAQIDRILKEHPSLRLLTEMLEYIVDINVGKIYKNPSKEQKIELIEQFHHWNINRYEAVREILVHKDLIAEILLKEEPETNKIRDFIVNFGPEEPTPSHTFDHSPGSMFSVMRSDQKFYTPTAKHVNVKEEDYLDFLIGIKHLDTGVEQAIKQVFAKVPDICTNLQMHPLLMLKVLEMGEKVHRGVLNPQKFVHYLQNFDQYITVVPLRPSVISSAFVDLRPVAAEVEVDEERHSASSGSTAENSEHPMDAVDTVENPLDTVDTPVQQNFRPRSDSEISIDVVGGGEEHREPREENPEEEKATETETNTPTPSPHDAPSVAASTLPTPMSSPLPKIAPLEVQVAPAVPGPSTPASTPGPSAAASAPGPSTPGAAPAANTTPVGPRAAKQQKERRMKQLDESSGDSESDDNDPKTPIKKKPARRAARAPGTGPKRVNKKAMAKADGEDNTDSPAAPDLLASEDDKTPRANSARRKNLKRGADSGVKERKAKEPKELKDGEEEPPKKKRGRKKATTPAEDEEEEEPAESAKERCGVENTYCLCAKLEKKYTLDWVSCSTCEQWYHSFCVRMDNVSYSAQDIFNCCGANVSPEAELCLSGRVHKEYFGMPVRSRPVPQAEETK